ncbi:MAG TPA: sialidase family protein [Steroidobacteraceae bacterium]|nr:sialidase family protein [Steroidobacteraceae bacterium]
MSLLYSRWSGRGWGAARVAAQGADWFVNWADFPSVVAADAGHRGAHWLQQVPGNVYSYVVRIATSGDGGRTWSAPITPHDDGTPTEHGFVTLLPYEGQLLAVWLDGRRTVGNHDHDHGDGHDHPEAASEGAMTLRSAMVGRDGVQLGPDVELDSRTCDCCQTGAAVAASGPIVVYRDRGEDGTRDISLVRFDGNRWSTPAPVARDGWNIDACPVNGPAVDALGDTVVVAWFTGAGGPRVRLAFSTDGGRSFGTPMDVDGGRVSGRVDVVLLDDGRAVVSWLRESAGRDALAARPYTQDGPVGRTVEIAHADRARAAGFPQVARAGDALLFAWTEDGATPQVRTVVAPLR